jgi:hypothetical protein
MKLGLTKKLHYIIICQTQLYVLVPFQILSTQPSVAPKTLAQPCCQTEAVFLVMCDPSMNEL